MRPLVFIMLFLSGCANVQHYQYQPTPDEIRANMATFPHYDDITVLHTECYGNECDTYEE